MMFPLRKLVFSIAFNLSLFSLLMIGIQNSVDKEKVYFITEETISLPISFIIGLSFISGNITGSVISLNFNSKEI